jgi:hypothetical protein
MPPGNIVPILLLNPKKTCTIKPSLNGADDTPAILQAFQNCNKNARIVFVNETYHVNTVMNTTGLENVDIDLFGTLLWSTNVTYWLSASLPFGYQNRKLIGEKFLSLSRRVS